MVCYAVGTLLIAATLAAQRGGVGGAILLPAAVGGVIVWRVLKGLRGDASDYPAVMRLKYTTSALFVAFIAAWLALAHAR